MSKIKFSVPDEAQVASKTTPEEFRGKNEPKLCPATVPVTGCILPVASCP